MKFLLILCLAVGALSLKDDDEALDKLSPRGGVEIPMKLCGSDLSEKLAEVCKGSFNPPFRRSYNDVEKLDKTLESNMDMGAHEHRRLKRQVATECCHSASGCTVSQMMAYCAKP